MNIVDKFGFLPIKCRVDCEDFQISPVDVFDDLVKDIKASNMYEDGFLYPHFECRSHMYKLCSTHNIKLRQKNTSLTKKELRFTALGFLMHLIGYVYGIKLQFHDWWLDGKIPFKTKHNIHISEKKINEFMGQAWNAFNLWDQERKKFFINILYMHNNVPGYEWDWERFTIEYMVFDACWKFSGLKSRSHKGRIRKICEQYGLRINEKEINRIIELRNELFHEALWDKGPPCTSGDASAFYACDNLRRIVNRLIPAFLGFKTDYIKTNWACIGCFEF